MGVQQVQQELPKHFDKLQQQIPQQISQQQQQQQEKLTKVIFPKYAEENIGGKIQKCKDDWKKYTSDPYILEIVSKGLKLDLMQIPLQKKPHTHPLSKAESGIIKTETQKLLKKQVITPCHRKNGDYVSGVFTRAKKDGSK